MLFIQRCCLIFPCQLVSWLMKEKDKDIENITIHLNDLSISIASEILCRQTVTLRANLLEQLIELVEVCFDLKNFFGAKAILCGINHPAITRLKLTYCAISREALEKLRKYLEVEELSQTY
mmetsp:Transcript_14191/g.19636  ORF Transcript_14191/g.19636 Transcript_14191/m.19636 type:complete len:121 (+) Transcript_14191:84-446(+)